MTDSIGPVERARTLKSLKRMGLKVHSYCCADSMKYVNTTLLDVLVNISKIQYCCGLNEQTIPP